MKLNANEWLNFSASNPPKRCKVAVIGGGASGITTAKCLREDNHDPVIFESTDQIGGVWVYRKTSGGTFSTVHFQHSKYVSAFSDYPMPENCSEFPHYTDVLKYLNDYVDHFRLRDCIKFSTIVEKVTRKGEFWEVTTNSKAGRFTYNFDAIAICTGIYHEARYPKFSGEEEFNGTILHSKDYKNASILNGKNVVVLGNGPSGVDIAVAASYSANDVVWCFRKKRWILPRYYSGLPFDFVVNRFNKLMPSKLLSMILFLKFYPVLLEHKRCNLLPDMGVEKSNPVFNEYILNRIRLGAIKTKPNISKFEENRVWFEDGTSCEANIVVYATGYRVNIPFMDSYFRGNHQENLNLYKMVFPPELPNCAFIGFIYGNVIFPCSELQARWFSKVLSGAVSLPSPKKMRADIQAYSIKQKNNWVASGYRSLRVSAFEYMDEIASQINVRPKLWRHLRVFWELLFGPMVASQYRLDGPNRWRGAEKWIQKVRQLARHQA